MSDTQPPDGPGGPADEPERRPERPFSDPTFPGGSEPEEPAPRPPPLRSPLTGEPPGTPSGTSYEAPPGSFRPPPPPPPPPPVGRRGRGLPPAPRRTRRAGRRNFDFGGVFGSVFKVYGRMWMSIAALSAILVAPGALLLLKLQADIFKEPEYAEDPMAEAMAVDMGQTLALFGGMQVVQVVMQMVLSGAITYLVVRHQQGRPVGIGEALARGLSRFFPIVGTVLLNALIILGMFVPAILFLAMGSGGIAIFLILAASIPAMMYAYSVYVCAPACAVEQTGPVESIKRSRQLCIGHRWWLLLLAIVMGIVTLMIAGVSQMPFIAEAARSGGHNPSISPLVARTVADILVLLPLGAIVPAMCYVELRAVKEGVDPEGIVGVFD